MSVLELTEEQRRLLQKAEQGDASVLPAMQQILDDHPDIWQEFGDLAEHAESSWQSRIAGPNLLLAESIGRKLEEMRQGLLVAGDSPLERLLVERILVCWLQVQHADIVFGDTKSMPVVQHAVMERRQTGAQARFSKAVQALATTRKLLRPALSPLEMLGGTKGNSRPAALRRDTLPTAGVAVVN